MTADPSVDAGLVERARSLADDVLFPHALDVDSSTEIPRAALDQIAATILEYDRLKLIRIEGHSDDQGDDAYNLDLSNRRAKAIGRALMERGVQGTRLKPVGYGETKPVADNKKPAGRALNRRVEFMIEQQDE